MVLHPACGPLRGHPDLPGDKSISHRGLLFGALASSPWTLRGLSQARDVAHTATALMGLGVRIVRDGSDLLVTSPDAWRSDVTLDCGNSGSTARMLLGLLAGRGLSARLIGDASLSRRPMRRVLDPLAAWGLTVLEGGDNLPLSVRGVANPAACSVALPIASAQVKTALALAVIQAGGRLELEEPHASRDHTERLLEDLGAPLRRLPRGFALEGPWDLPGHVLDIPGDPSAAAFWGVAAAIVPGSSLVLGPVSLNPGRIGWIRVLERMGCPVWLGTAHGHDPVGTVTISSPAVLSPVTIAGEEVVQALDEIPVLAVAMARARGISRILGARELRFKESDRLKAVAGLLGWLGVHAELSGDDLAIHGRGDDAPFPRPGRAFEALGDHRLAMAAGIASLVAAGPVTLEDPDVAAVSDPGFWATRRAIMEP
ncbi:MAG: 3-phosphoshikimate 1-carboxyvinyltransferase [Candidatus Sericytochromatia bacterium]|nr:3-phosphoshikimate 1-carboxyvinyltransferase [Candidatus Sericytochromatia bacterium]